MFPQRLVTTFYLSLSGFSIPQNLKPFDGMIAPLVLGIRLVFRPPRVFSFPDFLLPSQ